MNRFSFRLAERSDNPELIEFGRACDMPGSVRIAFDRGPDYSHAVCVEGRQTEVLVCHDTATKRIVGSGHRSIKTTFVNGQPKAIGYLSSLRLDPSVRNMHALAHGYGALRELHDKAPVPLYLTTIMEENHPAKSILLEGRCGLPSYFDMGRFCCMALSLKAKWRCAGDSTVNVRRAQPTDGPAIISFLQQHGRSRQFFPEYKLEDFSHQGGLLQNLKWQDVFLAYRNNGLAGLVGAWDQRTFRRWQVSAYGSRLQLLRQPLNLLARLKGMPLLPKPGVPLNYFILSLVCIRNNDTNVFDELLKEVVREMRSHYDFFLAGLHERDPLLPQLKTRPHFPLPSRLYAVAWEDAADAVRNLDMGLAPYLELGSL